MGQLGHLRQLGHVGRLGHLKKKQMKLAPATYWAILAMFQIKTT